MLFLKKLEQKKKAIIKNFVHIHRCKYNISICIDNHKTENRFDEYCQNFRKINEAKAIIKAIR